MSYRVILEGSNDRQILSFRNHDDALNFASMAVENGAYQDFHYEPVDGDGLVRCDYIRQTCGSS